MTDPTKPAAATHEPLWTATNDDGTSITEFSDGTRVLAPPPGSVIDYDDGTDEFDPLADEGGTDAGE